MIIMNSDISFSSAELEALRHVGEFKDYRELAAILGKSKAQAYRTLNSLKKAGVIQDSGLANLPYLKQLVLLVKKYPKLIGIFRSSGLAILLELTSLKTVKEIKNNTLFDEQTIYKTLQKSAKISLVTKEKKQYLLNEKAWPDAVDFFRGLERQEMSFDSRIPSDSIIYYKSKSEILFSNQRQLDATATAFSDFGRFGAKIFPLTNYYCLPKRELSKADVFKHALIIAKKEPDIRNLTFIAIFMLKNNVRSDDEIVKSLKKILAGNSIKGYPSRQELAEKAMVYGVELK